MNINCLIFKIIIIKTIIKIKIKIKIKINIKINKQEINMI